MAIHHFSTATEMLKALRQREISSAELVEMHIARIEARDGNLNAMAMEPLGHMAGLGAAFVGSVSTFISLPLGWAIGYWFDNSVAPLIIGFAALGAMSLAVMWWTERGIQ